MVKKCLECKYYKKREDKCYNQCELKSRLMRTDETCTDFTPKNDDDTMLKELEERVAKLERIVMRIL